MRKHGDGKTTQDDEHDGDNGRLRLGHRFCPDRIDKGQQNNDGSGKDFYPDGVGAFTKEQVGGIIAKGDCHHGGHDQHGKITQHDHAAGEQSLAEAAHDPGDQPTSGGIAGAQLGEGISLQQGDDASDQKGHPNRCAGDRPRLAKQGEDTCADHRADADEDRPAQGHASSSQLLSGVNCILCHVYPLIFHSCCALSTGAQREVEINECLIRCLRRTLYLRQLPVLQPGRLLPDIWLPASPLLPGSRWLLPRGFFDQIRPLPGCAPHPQRWRS